MENKRTTIAGILLLVAAVCSAGASILTGHVPDLTALVAALGGVGFILTKDGGV